MKIQKREVIHKGFYEYRKLSLQSELTEKEFEREQFKVPNSIGVLVFNSETEKIILVKQFRVGPEKVLVEIVAGKIEEKDDNLVHTAKREVLEETGYQVDQIEEIHQFHTCPGPVTEKMTLYYAEVSEKKETGGGVASEHEEIEVLEINQDDFLSFTFEDAKTIIGQQWYALRLLRKSTP